MVPYIFYDYAHLSVRSPLDGQDTNMNLHGTGAGVRGRLTDKVHFEFCWGHTLSASGETDSGANRFHALMKYEF